MKYLCNQISWKYFKLQKKTKLCIFQIYFGQEEDEYICILVGSELSD